MTPAGDKQGRRMPLVPPRRRLVIAAMLAGALLLAAPGSAMAQAQDAEDAESGQYGGGTGFPAGADGLVSVNEEERSFVAAVGTSEPAPGAERTFIYGREGDSFEVMAQGAGPVAGPGPDEWGCVLGLVIKDDGDNAEHLLQIDYDRGGGSSFGLATSENVGECFATDDDDGNGNGNGNGDGNGDDDTTGGGGTVGNGGTEDDDTIRPAVPVEVERAARVDTGRAPVPGAGVLVLALAGLVLTGLLMRRKRAR